MVGADWFARQRARYALPKVQGRKRGDQTLLCRVRVAPPFAVPKLRFRERAHREVLWRLRQADGAGRRFEAGYGAGDPSY